MSKDYERAVKTMAKGAGIGFVGLLLGKLFAYLTRIFIARSLGPDAYGLISMGLATVSILTTFSLLGLNPGLTRFIAFYKGKKEMGKVKGAIISSFKITLPISIFLSLVLFVFSENLALFFSKPALTSVFRIFSFSLPFSVAISLFHSTFLGFKQVKQKVYTVEIGKNLSTLLFVAVLISLGFNIFGATVGFLFGFVFSFFIGTFYLINTLNPLKNTISFSVSKELIKFSYPLLLVATLSLVLSWTDVLMLGYFDTAKNVGIYSAALNTSAILGIIGSSFGFIFMPLISELYSKNKLVEVRRVYRTSARWMFFLTFPLFLLFSLFSDNILVFLFGKEYISGAITLIILNIGYLMGISSGFVTLTITSIGKPKLNVYITSLSAFSNFIFNLLLIPLYGIIGAAVAMTVSIFLLNLISFLYLHKKIKIQPFSKNYLKSVGASILSLLTLYPFFKFIIKTTNLLLLIIEFLFFMTFYSFLLFIIKGLNKEDLLILKSIEKKTGLKIKWLRNVIKRFV